MKRYNRKSFAKNRRVKSGRGTKALAGGLSKLFLGLFRRR